jgi:hypothetical protein
LKHNNIIHEQISTSPSNDTILKEIFEDRKITSVSVSPGDLGMTDGADLRIYLDNNTVVKIFATGWDRRGLLIDQINQ